MWQRIKENVDSDWVHAILRTGSVSFMTLYTAVMLALGLAPPSAVYLYFLAGFALVCVISFYIVVARTDAGRSWRHWLAMGHDYFCLALGMVIGGAPFLIFYVFGLCAIIGHGLRYGLTALWGASAMSLAGIAAAELFNGYWRQNPFMVLMMAALSIMVPIYAHMLVKKLQDANRAEREVSLSKSRFLAQASHDLRQPIHAISLFTACLRDGNLGRREHEMVDNIDRSLQSVSRLFKSLLDVSTLDSGKVEPRLETVALADVLEDVTRQNAEAAQQAGGTVRVIGSEVHVRTDRSLLTTMLQNVVNNAVKYAAGQDILIGCRRAGATVAVQVFDRGQGIAPEHQARVFDEFYQVRERGDKDLEGVGLGLPIVKRMADLLGLSIDLRSVVGKGTSVTLAGLQVEDAQARPATRPAKSVADVEGLRVLLVEDDEAVLSATAALLRKWGCTVRAERSLPVERVECDLLVTDFDLGDGLTGTDCIRRVRKLNSRKVPAVVMTGHDEARVREDLGEADTPILSKPVRPMELRNVIVTAQLELQAA